MSDKELFEAIAHKDVNALNRLSCKCNEPLFKKSIFLFGVLNEGNGVCRIGFPDQYMGTAFPYHPI